MRKRDAGCLLLPATRMATGMSRLTAPTLLMNADRNAPSPEREAILNGR